MKYLICLLIVAIFVSDLSAQWLSKGSNIYYNSGNVGIGVSAPVAKLQIQYNSPIGSISKSGLIIRRSTNTDSDVTSYDKALHSTITSYAIPNGVRDAGYKIGVDASAYSSLQTGFAGTLRRSWGLWARAGIHKSKSTAIIEDVRAVYAELLTREGTVNNGYGVYIASPYAGGNIIHQYDLYASSREAKNYFAGNVGIGTSNPTEELEVNGDIKIRNTKRLHFSNTSDRTYIHAPGSDLFAIGTAGVERLRVNATGNIGIGTATPGARLDVVSNSSYVRKGRILLDPGYVGSPEGGTNRYNWIQSEYSNNSNWDLGIGGSDYGSGEPIMIVKANRQVGIGTLDTDAALTVKGEIHTNEVRVDLHGVIAPDYVFYPDYNLMPLEEVEAYINKEHHLPEVPSASEMEANGVNLKEMNMLLLKKVEELTLHMIQANKRIDELETEVKSKQ